MKETLDVVKVAIEEADNVVKEVKKIEETAKEIIEDGKGLFPYYIIIFWGVLPPLVVK